MFFWRFYSKHRLYLFITSYSKKYKKLIFKTLPKKILRLLYIQGHRKLKYIILDIRQYRIRITTVCHHLIIHKENRYYRRYYSAKIRHGREFCSSQCQLKHETDLKEKKKVRNLAAWGVEERPDEETRQIILRKKSTTYNRERVKRDPAYKLIKHMRRKTKAVLNRAARYNKQERYKDKISVYERLCVENGTELKKHIESQWKEGMNWENYGTGKEKWVIDHRVPLKYFVKNFDLLNDLEVQKKAFGKYNLQPMWWLDNAHKAAKLNYEFKYR